MSLVVRFHCENHRTCNYCFAKIKKKHDDDVYNNVTHVLLY